MLTMVTIMALCAVCLQGSSLPAMPVILGEFGAKDYGSNDNDNTDTTEYDDSDRGWFNTTAAYLNELARQTGHPVSWLFWAWNANSGEVAGAALR